VIIALEHVKASILPNGNFFFVRGGILHFQNGNSCWSCTLPVVRKCNLDVCPQSTFENHM